MKCVVNEGLLGYSLHIEYGIKFHAEYEYPGRLIVSDKQVR